MDAATAIERLMSVATKNIRKSGIEITNSHRVFMKASLRGRPDYQQCPFLIDLKIQQH